MKKIIKLSLFCISIFTVLAACNPTVGTKVDPRSFVLNVDEFVTPTQTHFTVDGPIQVKKYGDKDQHEVQITFSQPVDEQGIKSGISFYKLTNATSATAMPVKTPLTVASIQTIAAQKKAIFTVDTKDVDHLYIFLKAASVQALTGQKLNQDKDIKMGEPDDDDYAHYEPLGSGTLTGNKDYEKATGTLNTTLSSVTPTFMPGTNADANLMKKVTISSTDFENLFLSTEVDDKCKAFAATLSQHMKIEQFDWKKNEWEAEKPLSFTWDKTTHRWTADITVTENRAIRTKLVKANDINITSGRCGYPLKYTLKENDATTITLPTQQSGYRSLSTSTIADAPKARISEQGVVTITLTYPTAGYPLFIDNAWKTVSSTHTDSSKKTLFSGFDGATVKKENFKCVNLWGELISIKSIAVVASDVENQPHANDQIIITFEDATMEASEVYISPEVKTASFEGSYDTNKAYTVPAMSFTDYMPSQGNALHGWKKLENH